MQALSATCGHADAVSAVMSVCQSVRLSRSWIPSKRINTSSNFFTIGQPSFYFFCTKHHGNIPTGNPLTGESSAGAWNMAKNAIVDAYLATGSMTAGLTVVTVMGCRSVYT